MERGVHSAPRMELIFDHGTLLLEAPLGPPPGARDGSRGGPVPPHFLWDPRVGRFRAHAFRLAAATAWLQRRGLACRFRSARPEGFAPLRPVVSELPALRPYQEEALRAWHAAGERGLVALPTGSGKTRLAIHAILRVQQAAIVLVPTRQLLAQWRAAIGPFYPGPVGAFGDGERTLEPITVATYESARLHLDRIGDRFDLLVVDEAHHGRSAEVLEATQMTTAPRRLGLTATLPDEETLGALEETIGPVVFALPVAQLIGTYLSELELHLVPCGLTLEEKREHERCRGRFRRCLREYFDEHPAAAWEDFARAAWATPAGREAFGALRRARELVALPRAKLDVIDGLLDAHAAEQKLVFTADNASAYEVSRRFLIPAITCDIDRAERELIVGRFRDGVYRTLVSARVLDEGFDVPAASVAIIAGGSGSPRAHIQRIGRVLRPVPGKTAIVYDLVVTGAGEWRAAEGRSRNVGHVAPVR